MKKNKNSTRNREHQATHAKASDEAIKHIDVAESLKKLSDNLYKWAVNLKQNVSDSFEDYVETRHVYIDRKMSPNWAHYHFYQKNRIYELLEFHKGVEYARAFMDRIYEFDAEIMVFVEFALSCQSSVEVPQFTEFCTTVEDKRKELERKALSLVDHINLIYSLMKTSKIKKSYEEGQKVSLTDNEETTLYDMTAHEHQCRLRSTISATTNIKEGTLKRVLKSLEEKGLVCRPSGLRSGYTITPEGMMVYETISAD